MTYPMFDPNSLCPKCGHNVASSRWCAGPASAQHVPGCQVEPSAGDHIHRTCARCGHERIEKPLDSGGGA